MGVVGRYVARSWSSGSGPPRGAEQRHNQPPPHRNSHHWKIPAFFRRKFEIAQVRRLMMLVDIMM